MANTKIENRDTKQERGQRGLMRLSLTNFANTSEPAIEAGSVVEVAGSLYVFTGDESISGWSGIANDTDAYIVLTVGTDQVSASFETTVPVWDGGKQGWYESGTTKRYIGGLHRGASSADYEGKWLYQQSMANNDNHRALGNGNWEFDGDVSVAGDVTITGDVTTSVGRIPAGTLTGTDVTQNQVFDALDSAVPNTGDLLLVNGGVYGLGSINGTIREQLHVFSHAERMDATTIRIYVANIIPDATTNQGDNFIDANDGDTNTFIQEDTDVADSNMLAMAW